MKRYLFLFFVVAFFSHQASGQKAKYLGEIIHKVTRHVSWPTLHNEYKFVVGVAGNLEDFRYFQQFAMVRGLANHTTVEVRYFEYEEEMEACDFIYISEDCKVQIEKIVRQTRKKPILIVSGSKDYGSLGSVINFVDHQGKLSIELNLQEAHQRGLNVSDELKKLAVPIS